FWQTADPTKYSFTLIIQYHPREAFFQDHVDFFQRFVHRLPSVPVNTKPIDQNRRHLVIDILVIGYAYDLHHASGDLCTLLELWFVPRTRIQDVRQDLHRIPDVHVSQIQRRKAESQNIGCAKITNYAARDQGLHHGITFGVAQTNLTSAFGRIERRHHVQFV